MRQLLTITGTALLLAACSSERSGEFTTEDGETVEYTTDTGNGESTATFETEDGTATFRTGENVPVDLPNGFTAYPGAKIVSNTTVDSPDGSGAMVMFETDDSPEQVASYYRKQAEDGGLKIETEATINGGKMIAGEGPDGASFFVNANNDGEKTTAQLMVGLESGG